MKPEEICIDIDEYIASHGSPDIEIA